MKEWFKNNAWSIIFTITGIIVAYSAMGFQVKANTEKVENLEQLIERVIRLEEHDTAIADDIREIKLDIRDIKNTLNVK
jgi:hypothetical protein